MKKSKIIIPSMLMVLACGSVIAGSTYALFTSESDVNIAITSGKVDVKASVDGVLALSHKEADETEVSGYKTVDGTLYSGTALLDTNTQSISIDKMVPMDKIEFTIKVTNDSNVTVKYRTVIKCTEDDGLFEGLKITIGDEVFNGVTAKTEYETFDGSDKTVKVVIEMPVDSGNKYQNKSCKLVYMVEAIQGNAKILRDPVEASVVVPTLDTDNKTTEKLEIKSVEKVADEAQASAVIPAGVKISDNATELKLTVTELSNSNPSNITVKSDEKVETLEVKLEGLDSTNTEPVQVSFYVQEGLANFALYHSGIEMDAVSSVVDVDENNEYYYNYTTGMVTMAVDTFSPFTYKYQDAATAIIYPEGVSADSFPEVEYTTWNGTSATTLASTAYVDANGVVQYVADVTDAIEAGAKFIYLKEGVNVKINLSSQTNRTVDLTHDITIYANGADFDYGEISLNCTDTGKSTNLKVEVYNAKNIYVWGYAPNANVVQDFSLVNCHNVGEHPAKTSGRLIYLVGYTGIVNITLDNCSVTMAEAPVYCNADGNLLIENCSFKDCASAIKISHKGTGTRNVTISNTTFDGCGCTEELKTEVSGQSYLVEDSSSIKCKSKGTMVVTLNNITITNVVGDASIVLGESGYNGVITGTANNVTVAGNPWSFSVFTPAE